MSETLSLLIRMAGDNSRAFIIGGKNIRGFTRTVEGRALLRVLILASSTIDHRSRVGLPRVRGQRRTPEEERLAALPVEDGFNLLADEEPALREAAAQAVHVAETGRGRGDGYADVRGAVDQVVVRTLRLITPIARTRTGLVTTKTASLVVIHHLYEIANVYVTDFKSSDWPGGP